MDMLMGAAKRWQGIRPEGQMKEWLRGNGWEGEVLDAANTERWLAVRRPENAMERRAATGENQRGRGKEAPEGPQYDDGKANVQSQLHTIDFP